MMDFKRSVDPTLLAEFAKDAIYPVTFVFIDWPSDPVRAHSGAGTLAWDGHNWAGVGEIGRIDVPQEVAGMPPTEASFVVLMPIDEALNAAITDGLRGREVQVWVGATTEPGGTTLAGTPMSVFSGFVVGNDNPDAFTMSEDGMTAIFQVRAQAGQPARAAASIVHSYEDQEALFPGDTFFRRVSEAGKWRTTPPQWPAL